MAVIGTITTDFLAPGVSENGRLYTAELIERAVARLQSRLADPAALPVTMLSHHAAKDDSKELCARVVTAELNPATHRASMHGYLIDTRAGRDIAAAIEPDPDGRRVLDAVSIRGWWIGPVRTVEVDGQMCETGDDLEIDGIDFTKSPGVAAARIGNTSRLTSESDARTPITESVEVTVMSDNALVHSTSTPTPADVPPRRPGTVVADPSDETSEPAGQTAAGVRYIEQRYGNPAGLGKGDAETAETEAPAETPPNPLAETIAAIREAHVRVGGWQGPVDIDLDAWGISNDDVAAAATQLGLAYTAALRVLDPDNDDDLDLPDGEDVDADMCAACDMALPAGAAYCPFCGALIESTEKENTVSDTKVADKAAETEEAAPVDATPTDEAATKVPATEDAPEAAPAATDGAPVTPPATAAPAAGMSLLPGDIEAISTSLHAKLTAASPAAPAESAGPDAAAIAEAIQKGVDEKAAEIRAELRKEMVESYGTPRRKGLVEAATKDAPATPLHKMSPEEFNHHAAGAWDGVLGVPGS